VLSVLLYLNGYHTKRLLNRNNRFLRYLTTTERFEFLTVVMMMVFRVETHCGLTSRYQCFGELYCLHLTTLTAKHLYGCLHLNAGVLKGCSNYRVFLYKKSLHGKYWRKKIELFNIRLVEFQGVISCVAAFWVKRNTALRTYKLSFTLDIFPHAHYLTASCY
jgi:hypothetical protein